MSYRNYYDQVQVLKDLVASARKYFTMKTFDKEKMENKFQIALDDLELIIQEVIINGEINTTEGWYTRQNNIFSLLKNQLIDISEEKLSIASTLLESRDFSLPSSYISTPYIYEAITGEYDYDEGDMGYEDYIFTIKSILEEIITKDVPMNLLFSQYNKLRSSFLKSIYPALTEKVAPENLHIYAMTRDSDTINYQERTNFSGVAIGNDSYHLVTNNVFDIIVAHPPYSFGYKNTYNDMSPEVKRLKKYWNYLKEDGILVLNIPSIALSRNVCLYFRNHFALKGARVWSVKNNPDDVALVMYALVLQKMQRTFMQNPADTTFMDLQFQIFRDLSLQRGSFDFQSDLSQLQPVSKFSPVRIFKGEKPDVSVLMSILSNSPIYRQTKEAKQFQCQPPLPFEKGQIGLVLASGRLDGVIDEGNGYKHLIRGRVYKGVSINNEIMEEHDGNASGMIKQTKTITNLTEINVITGSGEYKKIIVPVKIN